MHCVARLQERLKAAERPAVLVGPGVLRRADRDAVLHQVRRLPDRNLAQVTRLQSIAAHRSFSQASHHGLCPAVWSP